MLSKNYYSLIKVDKLIFTLSIVALLLMLA